MTQSNLITKSVRYKLISPQNRNVSSCSYAIEIGKAKREEGDATNLRKTFYRGTGASAHLWADCEKSVNRSTRALIR